MPYKLKKLLAKAQPVAHLECRRVEGKLCCKIMTPQKKRRKIAWVLTPNVEKMAPFWNVKFFF